jgi:hypothetical protein
MSIPVFIVFYSNGDVWFHKDPNFIAPTSETGTLLGTYRIVSEAHGQLITTLTGSGNSSSSALALPASGAHKANGPYGVDIT